MPTIADIMTRDVITISSDTSIKQAASAMRDADIGVLPVVDGQRLVGMLTDRDIVVRGLAEGRQADAPVAEIMSPDVLHCYEDQSVEDVLNDMGDLQTRRIPVLDRQTQALIGIVSLGDLSQIDTSRSGEALRDVSSPSDGAAPMS